MTYSPSSGKYTATWCASSSYGATSIMYGLSATPCNFCAIGMETRRDLVDKDATYKAFYSADSATTGGFTSPLACVTKAGYGYDGRIANKCLVGSYNAGGNYKACTSCGVTGLTTLDDASKQTSQADCGISVGYGRHDGAIQACPLGECWPQCVCVWGGGWKGRRDGGWAAGSSGRPAFCAVLLPQALPLLLFSLWIQIVLAWYVCSCLHLSCRSSMCLCQTCLLARISTALMLHTVSGVHLLVPAQFVLCPAGTYNDAFQSNSSKACTACPGNMYTYQAGGSSLDDCNVCRE